MARTIIITGHRLADAAMALAADKGVKTILIEPYTPPDEIAAIAANEAAEAIIVRAAHITDTVICAASALKVIVKHGIGVDTIDVASATRQGIPVLITQGANAQSVAEHAFGLMFAVARSIALLDRRMREGHWDKASSFGSELSGKELGVVGLGSIGQALIALARPLGMRIRGYDPFATSAIEGVEIVDDLDLLLRESDVVSLHCPLTDANRHLINATRLAAMRPRAILINTARGGLIDEAALVAALERGTIAGAGLDCFSPEPPGGDTPLARLPNVVMTPHVGANTIEAAERVGLRAIQQAVDVLDERPIDPGALINPSVFAPA